MTDLQTLVAEPLTQEAFSIFGDVIETLGKVPKLINQGTAERFHDLAAVDVGAQKGKALLNIFRAQPLNLPFRVEMLERHPLGSQAFNPLANEPYLVVVADAPEQPQSDRLYAFVASANQGVNNRRNIWHHPLMALNKACDFIVIDRGGGGDNLQEYFLTTENQVLVTI